MFIVLQHFTSTLEEIDRYVQAHRDFMEYHFKQGIFIMAGPKTPKNGQIFIATTKDKMQLHAILKQDPYIVAELATFELIEFTPVLHCSELKDIILKTEGKLC